MINEEKSILTEPIKLDLHKICIDLGINRDRLKEFLMGNQLHIRPGKD